MRRDSKSTVELFFAIHILVYNLIIFKIDCYLLVNIVHIDLTDLFFQFSFEHRILFNELRL